MTVTVIVHKLKLISLACEGEWKVYFMEIQ